MLHQRINISEVSGSLARLLPVRLPSLAPTGCYWSGLCCTGPGDYSQTDSKTKALRGREPAERKCSRWDKLRGECFISAAGRLDEEEEEDAASVAQHCLSKPFWQQTELTLAEKDPQWSGSLQRSQAHCPEDSFLMQRHPQCNSRLSLTFLNIIFPSKCKYLLNVQSLLLCNYRQIVLQSFMTLISASAPV